jgi:hypothetical protein
LSSRRRVLFKLLIAIVAGGVADARDDAPLVDFGRSAIDALLRAPEVMSPFRPLPFMAEYVFKPIGDLAAKPESELPLAGTLDAVLSEGLDVLSVLVTQSNWTLVRPPDVPDASHVTTSAPMQARMAIPLGDDEPLEARLGIETDSVREDYFVFSTELAPAAAAGERWLLWNTRLDYRTSLESPSSARAEQRVALRLGRKDEVGVNGRLEDRDVQTAASPMLDLAPSGEFYWSHRWRERFESSLKVQQSLPDLQTWWLAGERGDIRLEGSLQAVLNPAARLDLRGTTTRDLTSYGLRVQLEFLIGIPTPQPPERVLLPERLEDGGWRMED